MKEIIVSPGRGRTYRERLQMNCAHNKERKKKINVCCGHDHVEVQGILGNVVKRPHSSRTKSCRNGRGLVEDQPPTGGVIIRVRPASKTVRVNATLGRGGVPQEKKKKKVREVLRRPRKTVHVCHAPRSGDSRNDRTKISDLDQGESKTQQGVKWANSKTWHEEDFVSGANGQVKGGKT